MVVETAANEITSFTLTFFRIEYILYIFSNRVDCNTQSRDDQKPRFPTPRRSASGVRAVTQADTPSRSWAGQGPRRGRSSGPPHLLSPRRVTAGPTRGLRHAPKPAKDDAASRPRTHFRVSDSDESPPQHGPTPPKTREPVGPAPSPLPATRAAPRRPARAPPRAAPPRPAPAPQTCGTTASGPGSPRPRHHGVRPGLPKRAAPRRPARAPPRAAPPRPAPAPQTCGTTASGPGSPTHRGAANQGFGCPLHPTAGNAGLSVGWTPAPKASQPETLPSTDSTLTTPEDLPAPAAARSTRRQPSRRSRKSQPLPHHRRPPTCSHVTRAVSRTGTAPPRPTLLRAFVRSPERSGAGRQRKCACAHSPHKAARQKKARPKREKCAGAGGKSRL
nr:basic proline-rich protein [Oryctolagus cuniculus]